MINNCLEYFYISYERGKNIIEICYYIYYKLTLSKYYQRAQYYLVLYSSIIAFNFSNNTFEESSITSKFVIIQNYNELKLDIISKLQGGINAVTIIYILLFLFCYYWCVCDFFAKGLSYEWILSK